MFYQINLGYKGRELHWLGYMEPFPFFSLSPSTSGVNETRTAFCCEAPEMFFRQNIFSSTQGLKDNY